MESHDDLVGMATSAAGAASKVAVVGAFVASLSTRRLDWRSALGSYAAVRHLPPHSFVPSAHFGPVCAVCGLREVVDYRPDALKELRRTQSRLIRFYDLTYATCDLSHLGELAADPPGPKDVEILQRVVSGLRALGPEATLESLDPALRGTFKSNKGQRRYALEALGVAGVLCPPDAPSYFDQWVSADDRETVLQSRHFYARDTAYPLQRWTGSAGLNEEALEWWFGGLIA